METTASAKTLWNHNALFDYMDRYMAAIADSETTPDWRTSVPGMDAIWGSQNDVDHDKSYDFVGFMWDEYRDDY
jgi:hypothetical protein